jgi:hypothetical protein
MVGGSETDGALYSLMEVAWIMAAKAGTVRSLIRARLFCLMIKVIIKELNDI